MAAWRLSEGVSAACQGGRPGLPSRNAGALCQERGGLVLPERRPGPCPGSQQSESENDGRQRYELHLELRNNLRPVRSPQGQAERADERRGPRSNPEAGRGAAVVGYAVLEPAQAPRLRDGRSS